MARGEAVAGRQGRADAGSVVDTVWGNILCRRSSDLFTKMAYSGDFTTSKVRIPAKMVGKLIGERGKTVVEISRDSKCRVNKCLHSICVGISRI